MPLRPFPLPFSIGTDIVQVNRIHNILFRAQKRPAYRDRFLRRFLTLREVAEFQTRFSDALKADSAQSLVVISKHLAGRWAAKEAAIKAVTWRRLSFHDVIIQSMRPQGALQAVILDSPPAWDHNAGGALKTQIHACGDPDMPCSATAAKDQPAGDAEELQGQIARISISHDGDYATAFCVAAEGG